MLTAEVQGHTAELDELSNEQVVEDHFFTNEESIIYEYAADGLTCFDQF